MDDDNGEDESALRLKYQSMTVAKLKELLLEQGHKVSGNKGQLIDRLFEEPPKVARNIFFVRSDIDNLGHGETQLALLEERQDVLLKKTVHELQEILKARGQKISGTKLQLIARLLGQETKKRKPIEKSSVAKLLAEDIFLKRDLHPGTGKPLDPKALYHSRSQYQRYDLEEVFIPFLEKLRQRDVDR